MFNLFGGGRGSQPQQGSRPRGLIDGLEESATSPLFLAGAGLLAGEGFGGALRGAQAGFGWQDQRRQRERQAESEASLRGLLQDPQGPLGQLSEQEQGYFLSNPEAAQSAIGGIYKNKFDPLADLERRKSEAELGQYPLRNDLLRAQTEAARRREYHSNSPGSRAAIAQQYGLDPNSEIGRTYILTGKIPEKTSASVRSKEDTETNISAGIDRLSMVPRQYSEGDFTNATGTYQGNPDSAIGAVARLRGDFANSAENMIWGGASTSEIRNRINGDTEALAAAIKPLIRAPGEGAWTDADQQRLVSIVGNLAQANSPDEYDRMLEGVRQRIMANFGLKLRDIGQPGQQQRQMNPLPGPDTADPLGLR